MRTITTEVYQIQELEPSIRAQVIERNREDLRGESWMFTEDTEFWINHETKWELDQLQYSLSYSQGDGLSFSGQREVTDDLKPDHISTQRWNIIKEYLTIKSTGNTTNHYCYAKSDQVTIHFGHPNILPNIEEIVEHVRKAAAFEYMNICHKLEQEGYEYFESTSTDAYIQYEIEQNGFEYLADGTPFNESIKVH